MTVDEFAGAYARGYTHTDTVPFDVSWSVEVSATLA
jgi:hypothetical protein